MTPQAPFTLPARARTLDRVAERLPDELALFDALDGATRRLAAARLVRA